MDFLFLNGGWEWDLVMLAAVLTIIAAGPGRISISHIAKKFLDSYSDYLIFLFNSVMNFFIFGFGILHPHALSCPPPEPPRSVAKILTILSQVNFTILRTSN